MPKKDYLNMDAYIRRRNRKIKKTSLVLVCLLAILMIIVSVRLYQENKVLKQQVRDLTVMVTAGQVSPEEPNRGSSQRPERLESLGEFKIYHYCDCAKCCGKSNGITATGTRAEAGRTIAVDPEVIPMGSEIIIDGAMYIAEDTGGGIKGNKIDMYVASHEEALQLGVRTAEVYIKK